MLWVLAACILIRLNSGVTEEARWMKLVHYGLTIHPLLPEENYALHWVHGDAVLNTRENGVVIDPRVLETRSYGDDGLYHQVKLRGFTLLGNSVTLDLVGEQAGWVLENMIREGRGRMSPFYHFAPDHADHEGSCEGGRRD